MMRLATAIVLALSAAVAASEERHLATGQESSFVQPEADVVAKVRASTTLNSRAPADLAQEFCPIIRQGVKYTSSRKDVQFAIDLASCCVTCALHSDCIGFSHYPYVSWSSSKTEVRGSCELMLGDVINATATIELVNSGTMVSPKPTAPPTPPQPMPAPPATCPPLLYYTDVSGSTLRAVTANVDTVADCCDACNANTTCQSFVFQEYQRYNNGRPGCFLFSDVPETSKYKFDFYAVSGVKDSIAPAPPTPTPVPTTTVPPVPVLPPAPTPLPPASCPARLEYNTFATGNISRLQEVEDAAACCDLCNTDATCQVFVYVAYQGNPGTKLCKLLKDQVITRYNDSEAITGFKVQAPTPTPTTTAPTPLPPLPTPTPTPTTSPVPTTTAPQTTEPPTPTPTPTTTPSTPSPTVPASCPLIEANTDYAGNDLHRIPNLDQAACCAACNAEILCKVFTFVPDSASSAFGACYLKSAAGARKTAVGAYSGVKTLSVCPVAEIGIDYYGNDLEAVQEVDQSECCAKCNADTRCNAFTFVPYGSPSTKGACYLKSAAAGRIPTAGAISGTKTTNVCPRMEVDVDYSGNDIRSVTGVDQAGCCVQCNAEPKCKAFTYVPDARSPTNGACYLKSSGAGHTWASGMHSGIKGQL